MVEDVSKPSSESSRVVPYPAIRKLAKILKETGLSEIEYEVDGARIRIVSRAEPMVLASQHVAPAPVPSHGGPEPSAAPPPQEAPPAASWSEHPGVVVSPMVGTAYHSPSPDADPFVKEGDTVSEGQTLMIIEAMKIMNPMKAPKNGVVKKVLVDNAQPVEFNQPLLVIE